MTEFDPNAPAFGQKENEVVAEPSVEVPAEQVEEPEVPVEENKVPYSRFKNIHNRALEAERIAAEYQEQLAILRSQRVEKPTEDTDIPSFWAEMYGDSEASKKAWMLQQRENERIKEEAREAALSAVREQQYAEVDRVNQNLETIDNRLEQLTEYVGRELTDKEQSALLDIVDEYTPQDEEGNYIGETIPFEKAWEIYELKQQASNAPKRQARDSVAGLSASQTQGEPSVTAEKNKNFNPLNWDAWKSRI